MPTVPPSWMRTLDKGVQTGKPPQKDEPPQGVTYPPDRVLRAKVWENKEAGSLPFSEEDAISLDESAVFPEDAIEDLPTAQLEANIPEPPIQKPIGTPSASSVWDSRLDDVAQLSTRRLESQNQVKPVEPLKQEGATPSPVHHRPDAVRRPMQAGEVVFQNPPLTPQIAPIYRHPSAKPVSHQGMSHKRLVIVLILLFVLVASGIAVLIITIKPFSVPAITQPWQQFCDSGLGVSGQYPTGWMKQVDKNQGVHFSDGTDQFSVVFVAANGQDAGTYLKKEASQLGITGLKPGTPASFAGTSWQQAQGSLLSSQTGVTYTETLFVTMHGNRFFTIMQIAPPGTYNDEDATNFSGMRSSFQFSNSCP